MYPFATSHDALTVADWGEITLIQKVHQWLGDVVPPPPEGIGDDCAVVSVTEKTNLLLTTDSLVFNKHFGENVSPEEAGRKLINRNISDIAAMAGTPSVALISLFLPSTTRIDWLERFHRGMAEAAREWDLRIVGGDITSTFHDLAANVALYGKTTRPILRNSTQPGDTLWVTGSLGGSIAHKHHSFRPRIKEAQKLHDLLGEQLHSMIDVTDGIAKDLHALLSDTQAASLNLTHIPISDDARQIAGDSVKQALEHAFCDGEDYELLIAVDAQADTVDLAHTFEKATGTPITCIGKVIPRNESIFINEADGSSITFARKGYEHFR